MQVRQAQAFQTLRGPRRMPPGKPVAAKAVGSFVPRLTRTVFAKHGLSAGTLVMDWTQIVGAELARTTLPERVKWPRPVGEAADDAAGRNARNGATLILAVDPAHALEIQYKSSQIIERINQYLGYRAIVAVRLAQRPLRSSAAGPALQTPAVVAAPRPELTAELAAVADPGLREALGRLLAQVARRSPD